MGKTKSSLAGTHNQEIVDDFSYKNLNSFAVPLIIENLFRARHLCTFKV